MPWEHEVAGSSPAAPIPVCGFAWARGRVTDQSTGTPVRAYLSYEILPDNPHLKDYPSYGTIRVQMPFYSDENGEFRIAVMPGAAKPGAAGST